MGSKVYSMEGRTGLAVKNQYVVESSRERSFQSYNSVCAVWDKEKKTLTLGEDWNRSKTTVKYFWQFVREYLPTPWCDMDRKALLAKIKAGEVKVLSQREIEF